jgi:hypothetical protein
MAQTAGVRKVELPFGSKYGVTGRSLLLLEMQR